MPNPKHRTSHRAYRRLRQRTLAGDNLICHLCGQPIDKTYKSPHPLSATADHITPISKGGNNLGTLLPAHRICNTKRGNRTPPQETNHIRQWNN